MEVLIKLFIMFSKLSAFSFGGGYVMIPIMLKELENNKLASVSELTDTIAIAGMSPGPVSVNAAVGLGYKVAGIPGVVAAFLGIALPCSIIVILVATFFFKVYAHPFVKSALYGLRPVITGIIVFASVSIALKNKIIFAGTTNVIENGVNISVKGFHLFEMKSLLITIISFILLTKTKVHPIFIILGSGLIGVLAF